MTEIVTKGQKVSLNNYQSSLLYIGINWNQDSFKDYEIDSSVMMLSESGKLEEEENFIFYNNPKSKCQSVELNSSPLNNYKKSFTIDLNKTSNDISRIMFLLTIDNGDSLNHRFGNIKDIQIDLLDSSKQVVFKYQVDQLTSETAIILSEIYKRNNEWKLQLVGNGFNAGLDKILEEYGSDKVKVQSTETQTINKSDYIDLVPKSEPIKTEPEKPTISLTKITLEKKGDVARINLSKSKIGNIQAKLFWKKGVDLDLHAFYKTKSGKTGHIYFGSKGSLNRDPYIMLDQDSGVGNTSGNNEENLRIGSLDYFDYILFSVNIFRFFSRKGENFAKYDGKVVLKTDRGDEITVPLISEEIGTWCVITMVDNSSANEPRIVNINQVMKTEPKINDFQSL